MKNAKYLVALLSGVLVYVGLSVMCGQNGIWAQNQLLEQKRVISAHTAKIQSINDELKLEKTAIRDDKDVIASYAKKLDYVFENEKLVKIKGLGSSSLLMYDTGTVLKSTKVLYIPEEYCKGAGIIIGGLLFFVILLFDISSAPFKRKKQNKNDKVVETIEGIKVYEVS